MGVGAEEDSRIVVEDGSGGRNRNVVHKASPRKSSSIELGGKP